MLTQETKIRKIEILEDAVQVLLELVVMNGENAVSSKWHRTVIPFSLGRDEFYQWFYDVNLHLSSKGEEPVPSDSIERVLAVHDLAKNMNSSI